MNRPQKVIALVGLTAISYFVLFPHWVMGHKSGDVVITVPLGRHPLFDAPDNRYPEAARMIGLAGTLDDVDQEFKFLNESTYRVAVRRMVSECAVTLIATLGLIFALADRKKTG